MASKSSPAPKLDSLSSVIQRLAEALETKPVDTLVRDAAIQRFEFSFELAWEAIQEALKKEGLGCQSPKSCLRAAFAQGWIEDEDAARAMLDDRNLTSHTYNEALAQVVFDRLPAHLTFFSEA